MDDKTPWTDEQHADWLEARVARIAEKHSGLAREFGVNMDVAAVAVARLTGKANLAELIRQLTEIASEHGVDLSSDDTGQEEDY